MTPAIYNEYAPVKCRVYSITLLAPVCGFGQYLALSASRSKCMPPRRVLPLVEDGPYHHTAPHLALPPSHCFIYKRFSPKREITPLAHCKSKSTTWATAEKVMIGASSSFRIGARGWEGDHLLPHWSSTPHPIALLVPLELAEHHPWLERGP